MTVALHGSTVDYLAFHGPMIFLQHFQVYEPVVHGYLLSYLNLVDNVLIVNMN